MKKTTLATVKSFIKKTNDLYISTRSTFDGMQDCVTSTGNKEFTKAERTEQFMENTFGIVGAWFVKGSRDYFVEYNDGKFAGFEVHNCCGKFIVAKPI